METEKGGAVWIVGAMWNSRDDQLARFLKEGMWQTGYSQEHKGLILSMKPGDRLVVKASYTRKKDLPFDNAGHPVSLMELKAIGTVTDNHSDGRTVGVDWTPLDPPRIWYFSTYWTTIQKLRPGNWKIDALIAFAFDGVPQEIDRFLEPWRKSRVTPEPEPDPFPWSKFYYELGQSLRPFRHDRKKLLARLYAGLETVGGLAYLMTDQYADGTSGPLRDICPYTVLGTFNRTTKPENRTLIAGALAQAFGVDEPVPTSFEGVPTMNNQNSWLFSFERDRSTGDIDALWDLFEASLDWAEGVPETRSFPRAFDAATAVRWSKWNLTMGLYWSDPYAFVPLDENSRRYIENTLGLPVRKSGPKGVISGADYLELVAILEERFEDPDYPVHSMPELSRAAWQSENGSGPIRTDPPIDVGRAPNYSIDDLLNEGCFLERERVEAILARVREKRNLVLQGPPGTGKTWLARRLAYALIGRRDPERVTALQFHPNISYEDFVRGWRPLSTGGLDLVDGPLLEAADCARSTPEEPFVVVIEEINRGNPAQIFGEALTLLERDKRHAGEGLRLTYPRFAEERVHLPPNLHVIGTMNVADRSLALVDLALRRRFAFVDLEPALGPRWRAWLVERGVPPTHVATIEARMAALNAAIAADPTLGAQYRVGHSFVTPVEPVANSSVWLRGIVESEIAPLLQEYWFDQLTRARDETALLLADL